MKKTHCVKGHDIAVVGRYSNQNGPGMGRCKQCTKDAANLRTKIKGRRRTSGDLNRERRWRKNNPIRSNQHKDAYRKRTQGLGADDFQSIIDYYGKDCVYCGEPATGFDHLHPVSKGGLHAVENLAPACIGCNQRKNNRPIWTMVMKGGD